MSVDAFRQDVWPDRLCVLHEGAARLAATSLLNWMIDVKELFRLGRRHLQIEWGAAGEDFRFERQATGEAARLAWEQGASLRLVPFDLHSRAAALLKADIARQLEVPKAAIRVSAFYMNDGAGIPRHFDGREVFNLQLAGTREWTIEPNETISYPDASLMPGHSRASEAFLEPLFERPPAAAFGPQAQRIEMRPGSFLFLPRGHWHATVSRGYSVSLSVGCAAPTRLERLVRELAREARSDPFLRAPLGAQAGRPAPETRERLRSRLDELLGS